MSAPKFTHTVKGDIAMFKSDTQIQQDVLAELNGNPPFALQILEWR